MSIRTRRINQNTPVTPINVKGLLDDTKDTLEQISDDILDAMDVTTKTSRSSNGVLTKIKPAKEPNSNGAPDLTHDQVEKALTSLLGEDAGSKAADVIGAIGDLAGDVVDIINDIIKAIPCSLKLDITGIMFSLVGYFSFAELCNPIDQIHKALSVTKDMFTANPSQTALNNINNLETSSIKIVKGPAASIPNTPEVNHFYPDGYSDEEIAILIDNGKVPSETGLSYGGFYTHPEDIDAMKGTPYLGGFKPDVTYTTGTLTTVPPVLPDEILTATNKAVGIGLTEAMNKNPNNTVAIMIYMANPGWLVHNMPRLPTVLIDNIKRKEQKVHKVITRELMEHLDNVYPIWYRKVTPDTSGPFVGLRDYYEASAPYMPEALCLSDPIKLTGTQALKLLSGYRHAKYVKHTYPLINAAL